MRCVQRLVALECRVAEQRFEQVETGLRSDGEPDRRRAVQLDDRRGRDLTERAVQLRDLLPVRRTRVRPTDVDGCDRGLELILARVPEPQRSVEGLETLAEPLAIPSRAVLLVEREVAPVGRHTRTATSVVEEHQGE